MKVLFVLLSTWASAASSAERVCDLYFVQPGARAFARHLNSVDPVNEALAISVRDQLLAIKLDPSYLPIEVRVGNYIVTGKMNFCQKTKTLDVRINRFDNKVRLRGLAKEKGLGASLRSPVIGIWRGIVMAAQIIGPSLGAEKVRLSGAAIWNGKLGRLLERRAGFVPDEEVSYSGFNHLDLPLAPTPEVSGLSARAKSWFAAMRTLFRTDGDRRRNDHP